MPLPGDTVGVRIRVPQVEMSTLSLPSAVASSAIARAMAGESSPLASPGAAARRPFRAATAPRTDRSSGEGSDGATPSNTARNITNFANHPASGGMPANDIMKMASITARSGSVRPNPEKLEISAERVRRAAAMKFLAYSLCSSRPVAIASTLGSADACRTNSSTEVRKLS